jgi:tetratricopeptide (TPR) repeat protein
MQLTLLLTLVFAAQSFAATPAETAIKQALTSVEKQPAHYPYYNDLAMAYTRRARETSDVRFYARAEDTLKQSFALAPGNFEGLKAEAAIQLGRHEYGKALETATGLNKMVPDDVAVYGYLVDANIELGNYKDAVRAAQWMLDLRPGNAPGLARAGYLRELHGNLSGALELTKLAYEATPPPESEERARLLAQMAHIELLSGDISQAEADAGNALAVFPDYHCALAALAQVRIAQKRYQDAVELLAKLCNAAPRARNLYWLAEAQALAGRREDAMASFAEFDRQALAESALADNANRELVLYYVDRAGEPAKALEIARREAERRHDIFTLDSYAWALAANGDYRAADAQIEQALAFGVKDPGVLSHAGAIARDFERNGKAADGLSAMTEGRAH